MVAKQDSSHTPTRSLLFTLFKNRILGTLEASLHKEAASRIGHNVFFTKRSLQQLASHLIQCVVGKHASPLVALDPKAEIEDMISRYSVGLGKVGGGIPRRPHHRHVVLLTGSTGGLGSYLLAPLLSRQDVGIVYAFNRPSKTGRTVQRRQRMTFEDRGLDTSLLDSEKLVYVEGDTSQPNLSLDDETYAEIRDSVTVIIHNAWRLNFNLPLSSFEPHVRGMRYMIDLARASKWVTKPRFLFPSSLLSGQGWDRSKGALSEEIQFDAGVAVGSGYGSSKYVSERVGTDCSSAKIQPLMQFEFRTDPRDEWLAGNVVQDRSGHGWCTPGCMVDHQLGSHVRQI